MSHHILVVDDDGNIRAVIAEVLEEEGFAVATARDRQEALTAIAASRPKLVLLDLNMPVINGWEVLTHLRNAQVGVPVVLVTAGYLAKAEAERRRADGYVAKLFELHDRIETVHRFTTPGGHASG